MRTSLRLCLLAFTLAACGGPETKDDTDEPVDSEPEIDSDPTTDSEPATDTEEVEEVEAPDYGTLVWQSSFETPALGAEERQLEFGFGSEDLDGWSVGGGGDGFVVVDRDAEERLTVPLTAPAEGSQVASAFSGPGGVRLVATVVEAMVTGTTYTVTGAYSFRDTLPASATVWLSSSAADSPATLALRTGSSTPEYTPWSFVSLTHTYTAVAEDEGATLTLSLNSSGDGLNNTVGGVVWDNLKVFAAAEE